MLFTLLVGSSSSYALPVSVVSCQGDFNSLYQTCDVVCTNNQDPSWAAHRLFSPVSSQASCNSNADMEQWYYN